MGQKIGFDPAGSYLGGATTDLISLYGVTPVAQRSGSAGAAVTTATITTAATSTTPWGFATSTQADAVTARLVLLGTLANELRACLVALGAHAGA